MPKLLEATLDAIVVERPQPTEEKPQHLCLDKGYDNPSGRGAAARHGYREHIRRIGEEKLDASGDKRYPARRWVVERTLGMALQVPCGPGPIRQEGVKLPRSVTARMCAPVVPPTVASGHFEIVTKAIVPITTMFSTSHSVISVLGARRQEHCHIPCVSSEYGVLTLGKADAYVAGAKPHGSMLNGL